MNYYNNYTELHQAYKDSFRDIEECVDLLTYSLNRIHETDHGIRYWNIILRSWLRYVVENYNHHTRMMTDDQYKVISNNSYTVPSSFAEFQLHLVSVGWKSSFLRLISLLESNSIDKCKFLKRNKIIEEKKSKTYKQFFLNLIYRFNKLFPARMIVYTTINSPLLYIYSFFRFFLILLPVKQVRFSSDSQVNLNLRCELYQTGLSKNVTNKKLWKTVCAIIPINYLEGYNQLLSSAIEHYGNPVRVVLVNNIHADDLYKAWVANSIENNTKLITCQHGGGYGINFYNDIEYHEILVSDLYLSWFSSTKNNVMQVPSNKIIKRVNEGNDIEIALVNTAVPRFYKYYSGMIEDQVLKNVDDQLDFLDRLNNGVLACISIRQFPCRYDVDFDKKYCFSGYDRYVDDSSNYNNMISNADLVVLSYYGTSWLECLMNNIPTIVFVNPLHWERKLEVKVYLDKLRSVGILYDTPCTAAKHLNDIYLDIGAWWNDEILQSVRKEFCQRFAYTERNWEKKWVDAIGSILKE